jgi:hypothetical protein
MKMVVSSVSIVEASKPSNIAATTMQGGYEFPAQPLHNFLSCGAGVKRLKPNQQARVAQWAMIVYMAKQPLRRQADCPNTDLLPICCFNTVSRKRAGTRDYREARP